MDPVFHLVISLIALLVAAISLLDKFYGKGAQRDKEMAQMREELASLRTKVEPFWGMIEKHLPGMLKQPIHLTMDALLDRYATEREKMSTEDLIRLKDELLIAKEQAKAKKDPRMIGYVWMAGIVSSRILERQDPNREQRKKGHWYDKLRFT